MTVENNPHLQELQLATNQKARPVIHQVSFNQKQNGTPQTNEETRFADPKKAGPVFNTQRVKPRKVERLGSETVPPVVRSIPATKQQFSPPPEKEKSRKTFRDEFDPEIFNQQMHSPGDQ